MKPIICRHYRTKELMVIEEKGSGIEITRSAGDAETDILVSPALFDIQVNGFKGIDFSKGDLELEEALELIEEMRRHGVAYLCPTVLTSSPERMRKAFSNLSRLCDESRILEEAFVGFHMEGPYISSEEGPRGAHDPRWARDPNWDEFLSFQDAARGRIRIVTLAPEREGALSFIEKATREGVVVAIGHTGASPCKIRDAISAGAKLSTHLGNGAHALLPRHPNYIWEQLASDELYASIIADGYHLPPSVVRCFIRCKGIKRTILISDIVPLGGMPPGIYRAEDGREIEVSGEGKISLAGTPYLAGSGTTLDKCIVKAADFAGIEIPDAIDMASVNPARLLGLWEDPFSQDIEKRNHVMLFKEREGGIEIVQIL